jgi:hypothetical protein
MGAYLIGDGGGLDYTLSSFTSSKWSRNNIRKKEEKEKDANANAKEDPKKDKSIKYLLFLC